MNKLKGLTMKWEVTNNQELSEAIQKRIFELGGEWIFSGTEVKYRPGTRVIHLENGKMNNNGVGHNCHIPLSTLDDLYHLPETHTISFDGGDPVEISAESAVALKKAIEEME